MDHAVHVFQLTGTAQSRNRARARRGSSGHRVAGARCARVVRGGHAGGRTRRSWSACAPPRASAREARHYLTTR